MFKEDRIRGRMNVVDNLPKIATSTIIFVGSYFLPKSAFTKNKGC